MRLLETHTLQLVDFITPPAKYAILSHTWGEGEVSFQEWRTLDVSQRKGYQKISSFCSRASQDGYAYGWVDTCCIDKSSSAELSEAINSMYQWYERADLCYVYLSDVEFATKEAVVTWELGASRWFTRGWTLQELLAPDTVAFFDKQWTFLGTKVELVDYIAVRTGVEKAILTKREGLGSATIAQRMSWASRRVTTRTEDIAYCMLGIFGVNMPLLYGEGISAFKRLQEAILSETDDQSILAWHTLYSRRPGLGALALFPASFEACDRIVPYFRDPFEASEPWTMTNKGLRLHLPILEVGTSGILLGILNCTLAGNFSGPIAIQLRQTSKGVYSRVMESVPPEHKESGWSTDAAWEAAYRLIPAAAAKEAVSQTIFVRGETIVQSSRHTDRLHAFLIRGSWYPFYFEVYPKEKWNEPQMTIYQSGTAALTALTFRWRHSTASASNFKSQWPPFIVMLRPSQCKIYPASEIPITRAPVREAQKLLQNFKGELQHFVTERSFTSPTAVAYAQRYSAEPARGDIGGIDMATPDYDAIFADMKSETDVIGPSSDARDVNDKWRVSVTIQPEDIMGLTMLVVDIRVESRALTWS